VCFNSKKEMEMKRILKKTGIIFLCTALLLTKNIAVQAQQRELPIFVTSPAQTKHLEKQADEQLNKKFKVYEVASFPVEELGKFLKANNNIESEFQLKLAVKVYEVKLQSSKIVAANYKLTIQEPTGMRTIHEMPDNIFYKGFANNDKTNIVRLTLKEGLVSGYIQQDGKEIFIESLSNYIPTAAPNDVIIYNTTDAIATENNTCGVTERTGMIERATTQQRQETTRETLTGVCKKLKFVFITDYTMYQYFNGDIAAMQNKMLAILNNAQGVYTELNFGTDTTVDVGTDELNFEMVNFHVSTCAKCDVIDENEVFLQGNSIATIRRWIRTYADTTSPIASYYWTRKQMYLLDIINKPFVGIMFDGFFNCNPTRWALMACMYKPDDGYLRQVTAHELGHAFGCYHDNNVSPSVNSYIMYSSVNPAVSKLSSLTDFPGILIFGQPYSSKLAVGNVIRKLSPCLSDCNNFTCAAIENLTVRNFTNGDSILVKWEGASTNYSIKVREKTNLNLPYIISGVTSEKSFVLKGLNRCSFYTVEVQNNCGTKSSLTFSTSSIKVSEPKVMYERADLYDVEVNVGEAINFLQDSLRITVDHVTKWYKPTLLPQKIQLKNLFSDGARHRVDVYQGSGANCRATVFYTAPYYRKDATILTNADFNDCKVPIGWKDSILYKGGLNPFIYTPYWTFQKMYQRITVIPNGTIDSTCMIAYNNESPGNKDCAGSILLSTNEIDISNYTNKILSFDYAYSLRLNNNRRGVFKVEAFNGNNWIIIFNAEPTKILSIAAANTFWDTMPTRKFISVDTFTNKDFKVRFVVDDSSFNNPAIRSLFVALDNIKVDAYKFIKLSKGTNIKLFPNPAKNEIFVRTNFLDEQPIGYIIMDAAGKMIEHKPLLYDRINVERLASAMYFIQFYYKDQSKNEILKFIKY
jgi:Secretion system C-terminal sorting domain